MMNRNPKRVEDALTDDAEVEALKKFEKDYNDQLKKGKPTIRAQTDYAMALSRSKIPADIKKGIFLLDDLVISGPEDHRKDYLYYLAIGNTKLKEYNVALKHLQAILELEPNNEPAQQLHMLIKKRINRDGVVGLAIVGGIAIAIGSLVGFGMAAVKKM